MSQRRACIADLKEASPAVLPSLLLCDFGNLESEIERLEEAGVAALHLDVMDGVFVPNFTYGMTIVSAVRKLTELPLDVHLMMVQPEKYIQQFYDAGADIITIHVESTDDAPAILKQIRDLGAAAGIAVNPDTPISEIQAALPFADLVLVMSVHAGFGGQSFIEPVLAKYEEIRSLPGGDDVILEIDGGINVDTIGVATEKGAQLLVAGSAVFKQENYATAIENLMSQVKCL
ncbi:MAG: ribulose-phosphate 3-epimerase [Mariniblastus sp.]|jgi:ribulose-phosphate 3-epimerase